MSVVDKLIQIAENEIGYLEKRTNSNLYDKTANAGSNNYTKYWAEIKPEYQGQPWCACFVTWCFVQAFGKTTAEELLKHYPYVYCPTMVGKFNLYSNPQKGDIVIFYSNGEFVHTGIVTVVNGDYFETVEGNTSGGNSIIANGGGVCRKSYYNSHLPGTKFCRPEYRLVEEGNEVTREEYESLMKKVNDIDESLTNAHRLLNGHEERIRKQEQPMIYNYIDSNMPGWAHEGVQFCFDKGIIKGTGEGLGLNDDRLWFCTAIMRAVKFVAKLIKVQL